MPEWMKAQAREREEFFEQLENEWLNSPTTKHLSQFIANKLYDLMHAPASAVETECFACRHMHNTICGCKCHSSEPVTVLEVERETDGRWIADFPSAPGCMAYGETRLGAIVKAALLLEKVELAPQPKTEKETQK